MLVTLTAAALLLGRPTAVPRPDCDDPLPIEPGIITREMKLKEFTGANQFGPVCHLSWGGGSGVTLMIYGPTALAKQGRNFTSARHAAEQYARESPKGVELMPGTPSAFMVFDPKTPSRRVFVESGKRVYMIVMTQDQIPVAVLGKAILR